MKRSVTILLTVIFLLSGIHFTVATHYCGGKAVGVKLSLSGAKASCGMESDESMVPSKETRIKIRCCYDDLTVYKVESHFAPAVFSFQLPDLNRFHHAVIHEELFRNYPVYALLDYTDSGPPERLAFSAVNASEICVFRI